MMYVRKQSGFSLLELLLVLAVSAALLLGIVNIFDNLAKRAGRQMIADNMTAILEAAESYVSANFSTITTTIPNTGDTAKLTVAALQADGYLAGGYDDTNRYGQDIAVYLRNLGTTYSRDTTIEIMIMTEDPVPGDSEDVIIPEGILLEIARLGGPDLGVISNRAALSGNIVSSAQEWNVPLSAYNDAGIDVSVRYQSSPTAEGGFLAANRRVSIADALRTDYLYRINVADSPELNVMSANLLMQNYAITNASSITVDRIEIDGTTTVNGSNTTGTSSVEVSVDQMAQFGGVNNSVGDTITARINGGTNNAALSAESLTYVSDANGSAEDVRIAGTVDFIRIDPENLTMRALLAGEITAPSFDLDGNTMNVSTTEPLQFSSITDADSVGAITADTLNAGGLSVSAGIVNMGNVTVTQEFTTDGTLNVNGTSAINNFDFGANLILCEQSDGSDC